MKLTNYSRDNSANLGLGDAQSEFATSERTDVAGLNESRSFGAGGVASASANAVPCPKCHNQSSNIGDGNVGQRY